MNESYKIQNFETIELSELKDRAAAYRSEGYRIGQICATKTPEGIELIYSFDKDNDLFNLKIKLGGAEEVPSITDIYWPAFIYENEVHDLFGIRFTDSRLDYEGKFFVLSKQAPWDSKEGE